MSLVPFVKRDPWLDTLGDLERIQDEMNRLFDFSLARRPGKTLDLLERVWSPAIDVFESKDNIVVKADIPGMTKDEIKITVHGNTLVIQGEKKREKEVKEDNYIRSERIYGGFYRAITLPETVDAANVKANYKNGVLELSLPKKEEAKPKEIKVDVS